MNTTAISITLTALFIQGVHMSRSIKAAAVQFNITLGEIGPNLEHVRRSLQTLAADGVQLAVLPEMWATGFAYKESEPACREHRGTSGGIGSSFGRIRHGDCRLAAGAP